MADGGFVPGRLHHMLNWTSGITAVVTLAVSVAQATGANNQFIMTITIRIDPHVFALCPAVIFQHKGGSLLAVICVTELLQMGQNTVQLTLSAIIQHWGAACGP